MTSDDVEAAPSRGLAGAQIALGVLAILLLLFLVWFFLLRADDPEVGAVAGDPAPVVEETPPVEDEEAPDPDRNPPVETFEVFAPKDPFDPLISPSTGGGGAAAGDAGGATTGDTGGTTTTGDGTATTTDGTGTTTTTTTTSGSGSNGGGGGGGSNVDGHRVRVIDVYRDGGRSRAQVQVDGTVYTVDEGERFADNFRLMSTSGRCATMLYGDDEFTLCEGEEILK